MKELSLAKEPSLRKPLTKEEFAKLLGNARVADRVKQSPCDYYTLQCYQYNGESEGNDIFNLLENLGLSIIRKGDGA